LHSVMKFRSVGVWECEEEEEEEEEEK
jgi:hypothetical protein